MTVLSMCVAFDDSPSDDWRDLQAGDQVRIVRLPSDFWRADHSYDHDTIALYQHLICQRCVLTVTEVDEFGPWVAYNWRKANGVEYHFLMINDDSWERA